MLYKNEFSAESSDKAQEKCNSCSSPATYCCLCRIPGVYLCSDHLELHRAKLPFFHHQTLAYPLLPDKTSKAHLAKELSQMIASCYLQKQELNNKLEEVIELIKHVARNTNEILENFAKDFDRKLLIMDRFIDDLKEIKVFVESATSVPIKLQYTPLEIALISPESAAKLTSSWSAPEIICVVPDFRNFLSFIPSNVYSTLHYSTVLTKFEQENLFASYSNSLEKYGNHLLDSSYSLLPVSPDTVLITGGNNSMGFTYTINLSDMKIENLPLLQVKRKFHSMAWICGFPAVIGGEKESGGLTNEVEVLVNNYWVRKQIPKMNWKRSKFAACNSHSRAYVIGGNDRNNVEVFDGSTWNVIEVSIGFEFIKQVVRYDSNNLIFIRMEGEQAFFLDLEEKKVSLAEKKKKEVKVKGSPINFIDTESEEIRTLEFAY